MIVEIGHFALVLAFAAALAQTVDPVLGRAGRRHRAHECRAQRRADPARADRGRFRRARQRAPDLGFLRSQRRREFERRDARDLQDLRRVGKPRRLDAAVGLHSGDLRRARRPVWPRAAARLTRRRARRSGPDQPRLPRLHSPDLEPVRAARRPRRSRDATSIRFCRTPASRSIRRCSISAMSASRSSIRSPPRR